MNGWLDLEEAQAKLLALATAMGSETIRAEAALGRVLARDLAALRTQPPADLSAMDGYAVAGPSPWRLIGESRAGAPFGASMATGEAVRISTGAQMPAGADSVLIQEDASLDGQTVKTDAPPSPGQHVRLRGFDFAEGDALLDAGTMIGPAQIALAIAGGHGALDIAKRPRIAVLDSGDELASDPALCGADQIPASNGAMIAAMLAPLAGSCDRIGPVRDDVGALAKALGQAEDHDILITSGGASVGDHDLVQDALKAWGAQITFWKVAIRPGKPLMVATREADGRRQVILGLPGNPVSSFVTSFLFALPLVRASMGMKAPLPVSHTLIAGEALPAGGVRREFVRGVSDGRSVRRAQSQDSSALRSLALANCLIDRPPGSPEVAVGGPVPVYNLQNG